MFWTAAFVVALVLSVGAGLGLRTAVGLGVSVAGVACALVHLQRKAVAEVMVAAAFGAYVGARALVPEPVAPSLAAALDSERDVALEGWVTVAPEAAGQGARLRVALAQLDGRAIAATAALSTVTGVPDVWPGDVVRFSARLRSVRGLANPGLPDASLLARAAGIDCFASVGSAQAIAKVTPRAILSTDSLRDPPLGLWALRWAAQARTALAQAIDRHAAGEAGGLLHTAVLGQRRNTVPRIEDGFRAAGATHVLSVSGLHLAAVAFVFFVGVRRLLSALGGLPLWVDPRRIAALVALPAIGFYTALSGNAVATVRSAVMMAVGLIGVALGRRAITVVAVAVAVATLMAWSPLVLFDVSFQLSVVSVLALGFAAHVLKSGTPIAATSLRRRTLGWVGRLGGATLAAGSATAPIVAHAFGEVTPAAPLGNLLLVPLVEMVVVPCGLAGAGLAALGAEAGGGWLLHVAIWGARLALAIAERFRRTAPVWLTRAPNPFETMLLVFAAFLVLAAAARAASRRRLKLGAASLCLMAALVSIGARDLARRRDPDLIVTFLDVGQGDAAVVQAPGGRTLLIDGGGTYDGAFDPGARVIEPFLRAQGITSLELVALSHPHPDHLGGLHRILARFPVGALWTSGDDGHNPEYVRLLEEARAAGVPLPVPAPLVEVGMGIFPLGPFVNDATGEHVGPPEGISVNDASLVLRIAAGSRSFLFSGDLEADGEGELAGRRTLGQTVASDVLKVPHHGSRTSSSDELLDAVRPTVAVMSLGWKNRFHFPNPEVIDRYRARGVRVLRTDLDGAVTVRVTPQGQLSITSVRRPEAH